MVPQSIILDYINKCLKIGAFYQFSSLELNTLIKSIFLLFSPKHTFGEKMINNIIAFMSNRWNLTIFQCILYFIIGWVMGEHLTWIEMGVMFIVILFRGRNGNSLHSR